MGATSVTGVGPGSAEGWNRGAARQTLGAGHLIGPHIVACGAVYSGSVGNFVLSGTATVQLPDLGGIATDYAAFAQDNQTAAGATFVTLAGSGTVSGGNGTWNLTIGYSASSSPISWMVVKNGVTL